MFFCRPIFLLNIFAVTSLLVVGHAVSKAKPVRLSRPRNAVNSSVCSLLCACNSIRVPARFWISRALPIVTVMAIW